MKEFSPGVRTVGVRNPNYWKSGLPHLDEIELIGIGDEPSRVNALLSGDVQLINAVTPNSTERIKGTPGFAVLETKTGAYTDLIMRDEGGITGNEDFRRGMKYLLDREQIRRAVFRGYGTIGNDQPIDPTNKYYLAGLPQRAFDPDKAKFYFQKAKLGSAPLQVFASPAADGSVEMAMLLQQAAPQAGLNLQVSRVPADGYWSNHWMKHPLGFGNINARPSADVLFTQFFKSDAPWNEANWKNPKFDQMLVGRARRTGRREAQEDLWRHAGARARNRRRSASRCSRVRSMRIRRSSKGLGSIPIAGLMGYHVRRTRLARSLTAGRLQSMARRGDRGVAALHPRRRPYESHTRNDSSPRALASRCSRC